MKPFSFIHAADLHLDAPFRGVSKTSPSIAKVLSEATFRAFDALIDACIEKGVDFLLIAGDIFNSGDRSLRAQLKFRDGIKRLEEKNIKVYVAHGNHDPLEGWSYSIERPSNLHVFSGDAVEEVIFEKGGNPIASISGISYKKREERRNLAALFPNGKKAGLYSIALLHCSAGTFKEHEPYAPCSRIDLLKSDYNYWALGHVHTKSILSEHPFIVYPGNPQALHANENDERGCFHVSVERRREILTFLPLDLVRWFQLEIDVSAYETMDLLEASIISALGEAKEKADGRNVIARIKLTGRTSLYRELAHEGTIAGLLEQIRGTFAGEPFCWLQEITLACKPEIDLKSLEKKKGFSSQLLKASSELQEKEDFSEGALAELLSPLYGQKLVSKHVPFPSSEEMRELIEEAKLLCIDRLEE